MGSAPAVDSAIPTRPATQDADAAKAVEASTTDLLGASRLLTVNDTTVDQTLRPSLVSSASSCSDSDDDPIDQYVALDNHRRALVVARRVRELEEEMKTFATDPAQRREHLLARFGEEPLGFDMKVYLAYMNAHPEDLPEHETQDPTSAGEEVVLQMQNEIFGGWNWPAKEATEKDLPVLVGPKGELVRQSAETPVGLKCWRAKSRFREEMEDFQLGPESNSSDGAAAASEEGRKPSRSPRKWLRSWARGRIATKGSR